MKQILIDIAEVITSAILTIIAYIVLFLLTH